jgi:hypothetical protein
MIHEFRVAIKEPQFKSCVLTFGTWISSASWLVGHSNELKVTSISLPLGVKACLFGMQAWLLLKFPEHNNEKKIQKKA